jgi:hypothetical protein
MATATTMPGITGMARDGGSIAGKNVVSAVGVNTNGVNMSGGNMNGRSGGITSTIATHRMGTDTTLPIKKRVLIVPHWSAAIRPISERHYAIGIPPNGLALSIATVIAPHR